VTFLSIEILFLKGPNFEDTNELVRLDTSDAKYVDIYHTNAGQLITAR